MYITKRFNGSWFHGFVNDTERSIAKFDFQSYSHTYETKIGQINPLLLGSSFASAPGEDVAHYELLLVMSSKLPCPHIEYCCLKRNSKWIPAFPSPFQDV